mgnify:FL=1
MGLGFEVGSIDQFDICVGKMRNEFLEGGYLKADYRLTKPRKNTVPMIKTWRGWMGETAKEMAARGITMPLYYDTKGIAHGRRPFNADDAHEMFIRTYLGVDEDNERFKTAIKGETDEEIQEQRGKMLHAMDRHIEFCAERGIFITIPNDDERAKLKREQSQ